MTQVYAKTINITNETYQNNTDIISVDLNNCNVVNDNFRFGLKFCDNLNSVYNLNQNCVNLYQTYLNDFNLINAPSIPNDVINLSYTFQNCYSLTDAPDISNCNGITSLYRTFWYCNHLVNCSKIPDSVTNMQGTFQHVPYLIVPNDFISNSATILFFCFQNNKRIIDAPIIPNSIVSMRGCFASCPNLVNAPDLSNCSDLDDMGYCFQKCSNMISAPEIPINVSNVNYCFDNCTNLTGDIIIGSNQISDATDCFNNTSLTKNVYIPFTYQNGENTLTYNSFINAGYDELGTTNGVYLKDINEIYSVDDSEYRLTNSNGIFYLENYLGSETSIKLPRSK